MILAHSLLTDGRTAPIFAQMPRTRRIIDVGPGIRPCPIFPCEEYLCIEPHDEYCDHLREWQLPDTVVRIARCDASYLLNCAPEDTTVLMLDVIEHMDRAVGESILRIVEKFEHSAIFTPLGWCPQGAGNPDAWGLNGGYWQEHRSAWGVYDFKGWKVHFWKVWHRRQACGAILAVR